MLEPALEPAALVAVKAELLDSVPVESATPADELTTMVPSVAVDAASLAVGLASDTMADGAAVQVVAAIDVGTSPGPPLPGGIRKGSSGLPRPITPTPPTITTTDPAAAAIAR